jgi:nucleotide-binding universal stress UspA family protein
MSALPEKLLLATDGSPQAALAARTAVDLSSKLGSEMHVIHVGEVPFVYHPEQRGYPALYEERTKEARAMLDAQVKEIEAAGGIVANAHRRMGKADVEIVAVAEEIGADMIVFGSRGLGAMRRALMGSVSDSVIRHAHCPVLVVRP